MINLTDVMVIGDIYILSGDTDKKVDNSLDNKKPLDLPKAVREIKTIKETLKQSVTDTVKPGSVHRPTAGELMAKDQPDSKKGTDTAMRESLDAIPELREAKKILEGTK